MRARPLAGCAALALLAGCGDEPGDGAAPPARPAAERTAIVIEQPADGSRVRARLTAAGALRVRVRLRGSGPPGAAVHLSAGCRPRACTARATAAPSGRWTKLMMLTTSPRALFVTIDAGARPKPAPPASVTTVELTGGPRAAPRPRSAATRPPPPAPARRTLPREVLVIGDSLAVGMADALRARLPGWTVRIVAEIGRSLAEGMRILAEEGDVPAIIAFSLFTNDGPTATGALEAAVRSTAGRPGGCAVWATIVRPPLDGVSYAAANDLLARLAGDPDLAAGLQIVDWSALVAGSPSYVAGDGVHATPEGYRARAELYAGAIRACAGER